MTGQLRSIIALSVLLFFGGMASGQVGRTGALFGTVNDETGAVIPGVTVTITNVGTGITRTVISDEGGRYRAYNLDLGTYNVRAELAGFQTAARPGIQLTVGREA